MKKKHIGVVATICTIICVAIIIPKLWNNSFDSVNKSNEQISQKDKSYTKEIKGVNLDKNKYSEETNQSKEEYSYEHNEELKENLVSKIEMENKEKNEPKIKSNSDMKGDKYKTNSQDDLENNKVKNNSELVTKIKESEDSDKKNIIQEEKLQNDKDTIIENGKKDVPKFTLIVSKEQKGYVGKEVIVLEDKEINIEDDKSAMSYLKDNIENVEDKGGFINKILGIEGKYPIPKSELTEEQKDMGILGIDWFIYLNGEKTKVGANDIYLKEGDILNFDYHQWDKREFKQ